MNIIITRPKEDSLHLIKKLENLGNLVTQLPEIKIEKWLQECKEDDNLRYEFVKGKIANKTLLDFGCGAGGFIEIVNNAETLYNIKEPIINCMSWFPYSRYPDLKNIYTYAIKGLEKLKNNYVEMDGVGFEM